MSIVLLVLRRHVSALTVAAAAVVGAIAFAIAVEAGKLLAVGRPPNTENVFLASAGSVYGVTAVPLLSPFFLV